MPRHATRLGASGFPAANKLLMRYEADRAYKLHQQRVSTYLLYCGEREIYMSCGFSRVNVITYLTPYRLHNPEFEQPGLKILLKTL